MRWRMRWGEREWGKGISSVNYEVWGSIVTLQVGFRFLAGVLPWTPARNRSIFLCNLYPKTAFGERNFLKVVKCFVTELLRWHENEYWIKYRTFTCLVLSEMFKKTLYPKTGRLGEISDSWQCSRQTFIPHSNIFTNCTVLPNPIMITVNTLVGTSAVFGWILLMTIILTAKLHFDSF